MTNDPKIRRPAEPKPLPYFKVEPAKPEPYVDQCNGGPCCDPEKDQHCHQCCNLGFPF